MKKHKLKISMLMVPIILILILMMSLNTYAATEKQTITFYLPETYDDNSGWGPFRGSFTQHINLSSDMVFFEYYQDNGIRNVGYAWLRSNGSVGYEYLSLGTNTWAGSYDSDTVNEEGNIYTLHRHIKYSMMYGSLVYASLPYISGLDNAIAYLSEGYTDSNNILNYDELFAVPQPEFDSIYVSDNNIYKYYINLNQVIDKLNGFDFNYKIDIDVKCSDYEYVSSNTYTTDILHKQNLIIDLSKYISSGGLLTDTDYKHVTFTFWNSNSERSSDECTIDITYDMYGPYYILGGFPNLEYPQPYNKFKTLSDIVIDYWSPEGSGSSGIWQGSSSDGGGFVSTVINGFGLNGDSGLLSLFSMMFSFIPSDIWDMLMVFIGACIIVALFKLVIH